MADKKQCGAPRKIHRCEKPQPQRPFVSPALRNKKCHECDQCPRGRCARGDRPPSWQSFSDPTCSQQILRCPLLRTVRAFTGPCFLFILQIPQKNKGLPVCAALDRPCRFQQTRGRLSAAPPVFPAHRPARTAVPCAAVLHRRPPRRPDTAFHSAPAGDICFTLSRSTSWGLISILSGESAEPSMRRIKKSTA